MLLLGGPGSWRVGNDPGSSTNMIVSPMHSDFTTVTVSHPQILFPELQEHSDNAKAEGYQYS
jgi:hypothetical protein